MKEATHHNESQSGWMVAANARPDRQVWISVILNDDTYIYGPLLSLSAQEKENNDRSIVLCSPIEMRAASGSEVVLIDGDTIVISAAQIKILRFHYLPLPEEPLLKMQSLRLLT